MAKVVAGLIVVSNRPTVIVTTRPRLLALQVKSKSTNPSVSVFAASVFDYLRFSGSWTAGEKLPDFLRKRKNPQELITVNLLPEWRLS